ncbi:MAG: Lrp/AsnC family transcriptional regulator [Saccharospirillum sp.]
MSNANSVTLDGFDRKILGILQRANRTTSEQIADQVGLSAAAVQRRIKRLRANRVIEADVSVVNAKAIGRELTLLVQVSLERERADLMDAFKKSMRQWEEVQQCYYVTGAFDFMLVVTAIDMADYERFTRKAFFDNNNVRNFQTHVVMDTVKAGLGLPIPEPADTASG